MDIFEQSSLWTKKLANQSGEDPYEKARERLRHAFIRTRTTIKPLVEQIANELPELTIHNIDHLDNLWFIADVIMGDDFEINPAETFILGMAFLLHDAASSTFAFSNGIDDLVNTSEWKDFVAQKNFDKETMERGKPGYKQTLLETLRILHSQQAEKLLKQNWKDLNDEPRYLMEDIELRNYYGPIIGKIAASHGKDVAIAENRWANAAPITPHACLKLNANTDWNVDCLKIAMLMRCIDAAHIDSNRAPDTYALFNQPSGESEKHWKFQNHLGNVAINDKNELYWTGQIFEEKDSDAWWLCFDTMKMIDREIRKANVILDNNNRKELRAKGVLGAQDINKFLHNVPVQGWQPIDIGFQISQIDKVIERFGGAKLYGNKPYLALKELIQNATDAVHARRTYRENQEIGRIDISLKKEKDELWLHVQDNGIGMSQYVLTNVLLDFGRSLWRDDNLRKQWVGLAGKGFEAIGQFGIGFFSVFMLGDEIKVTTWRDGDAENRQTTLYLRQRANAKPILLVTPEEQRLSESGTCVSVHLKNGRIFLDANTHFEQINLFKNKNKQVMNLAKMVASLAPALDIDVWCQDEQSDKSKIITANDWKTLSPEKMLQRLYPLDDKVNLLDSQETFCDIEQNSMIVGRACIRKFNFIGNEGVLVHKGIVVGKCSFINGILLSSNNLDLARNLAVPVCSEAALKAWAENVFNKTNDNKISPSLSRIFLSLGIPANQLPIAVLADRYIKPEELTEHFQQNKAEEIVIALEAPECPETLSISDFSVSFDFYEDIVDVSSYNLTREEFGLKNWISSLLPETSEYPRTIEFALLQTIKQMWPNARFDKKNRAVGIIHGEEIDAKCIVIKDLY